MSNKLTLTIKADHVSVVDCGQSQVLVIINPKEVSPVKVGKRFDKIELFDHDEEMPMVSNGFYLVTKNVNINTQYPKTDVVNQVRHITLSKL